MRLIDCISIVGANQWRHADNMAIVRYARYSASIAPLLDEWNFDSAPKIIGVSVGLH
jgi:hypothetical protein